MHSYFDNTTKAGTLGGTPLAIFANISSADLIKTSVLVAVGAMVSFGVTLGLKMLIRSMRK